MAQWPQYVTVFKKYQKIFKFSFYELKIFYKWLKKCKFAASRQSSNMLQTKRRSSSYWRTPGSPSRTPGLALIKHRADCCVQISVAGEIKCTVQGPLVPSRWGGPKYNGAARRTALDNSAQRDTISFLWPAAPTLPALRHYSGAAQQQFSALYKSAHTDLQGGPSWIQTQWRCFNLPIGFSSTERLQAVCSVLF